MARSLTEPAVGLRGLRLIDAAVRSAADRRPVSVED
jgi:hypothetical protein